MVFRNYFQDISGQAVSEFALILPIFMIILFCLMELGFFLASQQIVTYACREGARAGALSNENSQIEAAIRSAMSSIDPGNSLSTISISPEFDSDPSRIRGNPLHVTLHYSLPFHIPLLSSDHLDVSSEAIVRIE